MRFRVTIRNGGAHKKRGDNSVEKRAELRRLGVVSERVDNC